MKEKTKNKLEKEMNKKEFVKMELMRFDETAEMPFRIAVSDGHNGCAYAYGRHAEVRSDYADNTVGFTSDRSSAEKLLAMAWNEAEARNNQYWEELEN